MLVWLLGIDVGRRMLGLCIVGNRPRDGRGCDLVAGFEGVGGPMRCRVWGMLWWA